MSGSKILLAERSGVYILKLVGEVRLTCCSGIESSIETILADADFATLVVDLSDTSLIDSTTLGLLAKLAIRAKTKSHFLPSIVSTNPDITRVLESMGFDTIYLIVDKVISSAEGLEELSQKDLNEAELRSQVLDAHKILMDMNNDNYEQFKDLVNALESDVQDQVSSQAS